MLGNDLLSHRVTPTVPSALEGLTTVFGMGTGVSPPPWSPTFHILASSAPPGAEALDLASFRRRNVVRAPSHLAHEPLLLHLAAELPKRLLELFGILDDYAHNPERIPVGGRRCSVNRLPGSAPPTTRGRPGEPPGRPRSPRRRARRRRSPPGHESRLRAGAERRTPPARGGPARSGSTRC